jgi:hypothetical protein
LDGGVGAKQSCRDEEGCGGGSDGRFQSLTAVTPRFRLLWTHWPAQFVRSEQSNE